jgi:dTDP-4-dehydrorhamnose reductase
MHVLIYGSNGWIGSQIIDIMIEKNIIFTKGQSRCDNILDLTNEINSVNPTHVICTIGRTHGNGVNTIDSLEEKDMLITNITDNLYGPLCIAHVCKSKNIHMTYIGTGCIFNKDLETHSYQYTEDDVPDFFGSSYSVVKGITDRLMKNMFNDTVLNVRIRMPIVDDLKCKRNFVTKILSYPNICSIPNSMTYLPELIPIMIDMMIKKNVGTINLVNPGIISHNEILELYKLYVDDTKTWTNISIADQNKMLKSERSNNWLSTKKLESMYVVRNINDVFKEIFLK